MPWPCGEVSLSACTAQVDHLGLIQELIGVSSLSAVRNLVEGEPVKLSSIVSGGT
jgi:hypothetical protein